MDVSWIGWSKWQERPWNQIERSFDYRSPSTSANTNFSDRPISCDGPLERTLSANFTYLWYFASKCEKVEFELGAMIQFLLTICWWFKTVLCPKYSVKWQLSTEYSIFAFKVKSIFSCHKSPIRILQTVWDVRLVRRSRRKVVQPVLVRENYLTWHWNHKYSIHSYFSVSFVLFALYSP